MLLIFLLIAVASSIQCDELLTVNEKTPYTIDEIFECIEELKIETEEKNKILEYVEKLLESYVFVDILKNPPEPFEGEEYYPKVDLFAELKKIKESTDDSFYNFHLKLQHMFRSARDGHFGLLLQKFPETHDEKKRNILHYVQHSMDFPFVLDSNDKKMKISESLPINDNLEVYLALGYDEETITKIANNMNQPIRTINGKNPFTFIEEFGKPYSMHKSRHAIFEESLKFFTGNSLSWLPFTKEMLNTKFTIVLENDVTFDIGFAFMYTPPASMTKQMKEYQRRKMSSPYYIEHIPLKELLMDEEEYDNMKKLKRSSDRFAASGDEMYCYTASKMGDVNTLVLSTFHFTNADEAFEVLGNCLEEFDKNTEPIQIILPNNGGGYISFAMYLSKYISKNNDVNQVGTVRISDVTANYFKQINHGLYNISTCKSIQDANDLSKLGEWYTDPLTIEYGDVEHKVTQRAMYMYPYEYINSMFFTNYPRNPNQIVVYSNPTCFSSCSIFTKGMKQHGSAIMVGFGGNPGLEGTKYFEMGQSATETIEVTNYYVKDGKKISDYGYKFHIGFTETYDFNYKYNETIPREFKVNLVDERFDLQKYDESLLPSFSTKTKELVRKYVDDCIPGNDRFVKLDAQCDASLKVAHGHGGRKCNKETGKWSDECIITYCDNGYILNFEKQECFEDPCLKNNGTNDKPSTDPNDKPSTDPNNKPSTDPNNKPSNGTNDKPSNGTNNNPSNGSSMVQLLAMILLIAILF